jgi:adenylate kinase
MARCALLLLALSGLLLGQPSPTAPLVVLLLGPPGGGKGTQSEFITKRFGIPAVSTGDLLRAEVKADTPLGRRIQGSMAKGELVADEIVNGLVAKRIAEPGARKGFILDGYPRTASQAAYLDRLLAERGLPKPVVIVLEVPEQEIVNRLLARGRADDKPDVIRGRIRVYEKESEPILKHYPNHHRIDGAGAPEEVFRRIEPLLQVVR